MKEVILTMKEMNIYQIIKKLVETNGNKKRTAIRIDCRIRNINLLITKYKEKGKAGFSHGNKLRKPKATISIRIRNNIVNLYEKKYF